MLFCHSNQILRPPFYILCSPRTQGTPDGSAPGTSGRSSTHTSSSTSVCKIPPMSLWHLMDSFKTCSRGMDAVLLLQQSTLRRARTLLHKEEENTSEQGLVSNIHQDLLGTQCTAGWAAPALHLPPTSHPPSQDCSWSCFCSLEASKFWTISKLDTSSTFEDFPAAWKAAAKRLQDPPAALVLYHSFSTLTLGWGMKALLYFIELGLKYKKNFF